MTSRPRNIGGRDTDLIMGTGFCHEHALILYVYLSNDEAGVDDSVLTVCIAFHVLCGYR